MLKHIHRNGNISLENFLFSMLLVNKHKKMNPSPGSCKVSPVSHHQLAEFLLLQGVVESFFQREAEDKLDLVAVNHTHPLWPRHVWGSVVKQIEVDPWVDDGGQETQVAMLTSAAMFGIVLGSSPSDGRISNDAKFVLRIWPSSPEGVVGNSGATPRHHWVKAPPSSPIPKILRAKQEMEQRAPFL